jgi:DNA-binding response OmpR family regulator
LVRAQVLVRRNFVVRSKNISLGKKWNITLDLNNKKAFVSGEEMHLSNMEMELLVYLVHNKWKTVSKEELLEKVWWEYNDFQLSRTVDVYVWYLRKKLWKEIIETIRWQWYVIY